MEEVNVRPSSQLSYAWLLSQTELAMSKHRGSLEVRNTELPGLDDSMHILTSSGPKTTPRKSCEVAGPALKCWAACKVHSSRCQVSCKQSATDRRGLALHDDTTKRYPIPAMRASHHYRTAEIRAPLEKRSARARRRSSERLRCRAKSPGLIPRCCCSH